MHRVDSHPAFPSWSAQYKEHCRYSLAFLAPYTDHVVALPRYTHESISYDPPDHYPVLGRFFKVTWQSYLKICVTFLWIRSLESVWLNASSLIIKSFQRQASRFKKREDICFKDLRILWKEAQRLHGRITLAATVDYRKKLPYFLQDEFLAAEDAYNETADQL
jgi:hypothetical protein